MDEGLASMLASSSVSATVPIKCHLNTLDHAFRAARGPKYQLAPDIFVVSASLSRACSILAPHHLVAYEETMMGLEPALCHTSQEEGVQYNC